MFALEVGVRWVFLGLFVWHLQRLCLIGLAFQRCMLLYEYSISRQ